MSAIKNTGAPRINSGNRIGLTATLGKEPLDLRSLVKLLDGWLDLLSALERDITGKRVAKIEWRVTKFEMTVTELTIEIAGEEV